MWIGERINDKGIGNGVSLLIFAGIIARLSSQIVSYVKNMFVGNVSVWAALVVLLHQPGHDRRRYDGRAGRAPHPGSVCQACRGPTRCTADRPRRIPLKVNASGVLPLIFASAIMQFPSTIFSVHAQFRRGQVVGSVLWTAAAGILLIFALLIFGFTFFYSSITFNPIEMSKNLQQNGGSIPGIRPGKPTADYHREGQQAHHHVRRPVPGRAGDAAHRLL